MYITLAEIKQLPNTTQGRYLKNAFKILGKIEHGDTTHHLCIDSKKMMRVKLNLSDYRFSMLNFLNATINFLEEFDYRKTLLAEKFEFAEYEINNLIRKIERKDDDLDEYDSITAFTFAILYVLIGDMCTISFGVKVEDKIGAMYLLTQETSETKEPIKTEEFIKVKIKDFIGYDIDGYVSVPRDLSLKGEPSYECETIECPDSYVVSLGEGIIPLYKVIEHVAKSEDEMTATIIIETLI